MKWVEQEGEFKLDYKWLVNSREQDFIPKLKISFEKFMGISMDKIQVL
jgi:hypothetical protein